MEILCVECNWHIFQNGFTRGGHVTRMDDSRLPKQLFHAELSTGKRHKGGQRKWYKDVLKSTLKACNTPVDEWQALAQDRPAWRAATRKGTKHFERSRLQSLDDKRSARKNRVPNPSTAVPCQLCGKICVLLSGSKLICANTSTDASSSYSKDYYYYKGWMRVGVGGEPPGEWERKGRGEELGKEESKRKSLKCSDLWTETLRHWPMIL